MCGIATLCAAKMSEARRGWMQESQQCSVVFAYLTERMLSWVKKDHTLGEYNNIYTLRRIVIVFLYVLLYNRLV